jgi:hypothetical protein
MKIKKNLFWLISLIVLILVCFFAFWKFNLLFPKESCKVNKNCPLATPVIIFHDHISKGEIFKKDLGANLLFVLQPNESGWDIVVKSKDESQNDDFAQVATPPLHGPTPLQIEAHSFISNDERSNSAQLVRDFSFVLNKKDADAMVDAISQFTEGKTTDFNINVHSFGKGKLIISNLKLDSGTTNTQTSIGSMDFEVTISSSSEF